MADTDDGSVDRVIDRVLSGGGGAGALARATDWSGTALGPVDRWSQALRSTAALVLNNHSGMLLWWGPDFIQIYNDAYRPVLGDKHPTAMGQRFADCWAEVFHILGPMAERPFRGGPAATSDDLPLLINRKVPREETHFRLAYSPVPDESISPTRIGGVLATVTEITEEVFGARQLRTLRELGSRGAAETAGVEAACVAAAEALAANRWDVPFALLYLLDDAGRMARLVASAGLASEGADVPAEVDLETNGPATFPSVLARAARERAVVALPEVSTVCSFALPKSPWGDAIQDAIALPLSSPERPSAYGVLVCGVSPHRTFDAVYRAFFELAGAQVTTALRNARAIEEERRRAEALAQIDKAKTVFFSNVSHEFRTPLTLMLGPIEEALERTGALEGRELDVVHRSTLRLLKLVNALLDFSRIEAGRVQASYRPTDLAALTRDLASAFRSAMERGGLRLDVRCEALPEPAYVDRDMWEKIVLNLLSNAFKFTFHGSVTVTLRPLAEQFELVVADTGVGIPAAELPRIFERFHRVEGGKARTHEGSGIGLAMVKELVGLHDGTIQVASQSGIGTTFTVMIPRGAAHLPSHRIDAAVAPASARPLAPSYVDEALRWSANGERQEEAADPASDRTVLVADDNADMRDYIARALTPFWRVETVADGAQALSFAREHQPDLILSDVMMPNLDGVGLVEQLKKNVQTAQIPVILLSARAGEESRVEGLQSGADDYLVKPFAVRELVARVRVHLDKAELRQVAARERLAAESANRAKDAFLAMLGHELRNPLSPIVTALQLMRKRGLDGREQTVIERQVDHLVRLVDDLLDVSRITQGKIELKKRRLELGEVVLRGLEIASPLIDQRRQRVTLDVPPEGLPIDADPERLAQVVSNLLTNAAKYSEPAATIHVVAERAGDRLRLRVRDEGIGIPDDLLAKVFDIFFQQPQSLDRAKGGLGLGLAIVRSLVELHGGTVSATSAGIGRGAEFVVDLPAAEAEMARFDDAMSAQGLGPRGSTESAVAERRILVVDDNIDGADSLAELLQALGSRVEVAHDGATALEIAKRFLPEICLVDIGLPEMDGYELARRLRQSNHLAKGARLIAVTGYGQDSDKRQSMEAGFDAHLVKPLDFDTITRQVVN
jgi:signal transduction histidine kinase